jgi:hypothetical protein
MVAVLVQAKPLPAQVEQAAVLHTVGPVEALEP